jgi:hypothetical protein
VINFVSLGLFAPRNATVIVTLFLCAIGSFWSDLSNYGHVQTISWTYSNP